MDPFETFMACQQAPAAPMEKSASELAWEMDLWEQLTLQSLKQASQDAGTLFNAAFDDELTKIAAADPYFVELLTREQIKAAFNEGFYGQAA